MDSLVLDIDYVQHVSVHSVANITIEHLRLNTNSTHYQNVISRN